MDDYTLYGGTPPHEDVDTSRAAAESMREHAQKLQQRVLGVVCDAGSRGLICEEIEAATGLVHQSASARVRELSLLGQLVIVGKRRATSGRQQRIYVATIHHVPY